MNMTDCIKVLGCCGSLTHGNAGVVRAGVSLVKKKKRNFGCIIDSDTK
jgi:hypothetical protein